MLPIGPLMHEHRVIERMVRVLDQEIQWYGEHNTIDTELINAAVDFFRDYADKTHHGKEEDILFRDLKRKKLNDAHRRIMDELISEHVHARKTVGRLDESKNRYRSGDIGALDDILKALEELADLYPSHIEKEDKHFFLPCMEYFNRKEIDGMLAEFCEFDRKMVHDRYVKMLDALENRRVPAGQK
jgi:hemerythrin-like domain-containing protein